LRDLIGGVPVRVVPSAGNGHPVAHITTAVADQSVQFLEVITQYPRAVVVYRLEPDEQRAGADARGNCPQQTAPTLTSAANGDHRLIQAVHVVDIDRTGRREVSVFGVVRALLELNPAHELRNQQVGIGVAVEVRLRWKIHRNTRDRRGEVGPVIEIEAAQVVVACLVGHCGQLLATAVKIDGHARQHPAGFVGDAADEAACRLCPRLRA
jgi:hypothetical protein